MFKGKLFFWACIVFILGIFASSFLDPPRLFWLGFLFLGSILLSLFWLDQRFFAVGFLFLVFAFGSFHHQTEAGRIFQSELRKLNDTNEIISLVGLVNDYPKTSARSQQLKLAIERRENSSRGVEEIVLATVGKYPEYRYGDRIKIVGKLKAPENFEGFDYQGYLRKERVYSIMLFPQIELLAFGQGNPVRQVLFNFKNKFQETWRRLLSPPHLGIFEALTFGEEGNLSAEWKEKLNLSGTRHLAAVSGMNITIISFLLSGFLLSLGLWRQQAATISLIVIWLFILMIGAPASALRAGLMVSVVFLAQLWGRQNAGERSLVFAAVILLYENPLILKFDVGFQLSFLAMAGLIYWQPFFKERLLKNMPDFFKVNLATTFAAQVFTLPLLIYNFGYVSLVSPLTNLLLVPMIPYLTMAGFVFGVLGIVSFSLGQVLAWFVWLGAGYVILVVDWSLKIPFNHLTFKDASGLFLIISYLCLGYLTWRMRERSGPKFLSY